MIWVTLDDPHILTELKDMGQQAIVEAIWRNKKYRKPDIDLEDKYFLIEPTDEELRAELRKLYTDTSAKNTVILSFKDPSQSFLGDDHPFTHFEARGKFFPYRKSDIDTGIPKEQVLSQRLGFSMRKPRFGFESIAGQYRLKERIGFVKYMQSIGFKKVASAFFMFGTAGSGKTHSAEGIAEELGMNFGYLDLPHFMSLPSPTRALDELFDFLQEQKEPCVLLIDEIEKMFDFEGNDLRSKNLFGKLLTRLNDIYNDENNKILFIATANDISKIIRYNPEFLRKGRFNELFFSGYPKEKGALEIIDLYLKKSKMTVKEVLSGLYDRWLSTPDELNENGFKGLYRLFSGIKKGEMTLDEVNERLTITTDAEILYDMVENAFDQSLKVSAHDEFIYSPPEIKSMVETLQLKAIHQILLYLDAHIDENGEIATKDIPNADKFAYDTDFMKSHVKSVIPLQMSAKESIERQIAQARYFSKDSGGKKSGYELFTQTE